jgi:hypothetical protein
VPRDGHSLFGACGSAKKPIEVTEMNIEDFQNFGTLMQSAVAPLVARKKNEEREYFMLSKLFGCK